MVKIGKRPPKCYRRFKRANTRYDLIGKSMEVPEGMRTSVFGNRKGAFSTKAQIVASKNVQVSAKAIVSIRVAIHRELRVIGETNYRMEVKSYPHHLVRSHGLVGVAKAERIASGMGKGSFGFPEMRLARVRKGHPLIEVISNDDPIAFGIIKRAFHTAICKLPPIGWNMAFEGFSEKTKSAKVALPKRIKEKKGAGGQQVADLQKDLRELT